ncbi:hypothetical protein AWV80_36230 [Cupriavidus sp. UYMU48A]|nr:hypothetical protein AWV80_36230 [Cupriavidus sp. UYMU48A]
MIGIVIARKSRNPLVLLSAELFVAKSQDRCPSGWKYLLLTHRAPLLGCRRLAQFQSRRQMCESIDEKLAFATT